VIRMHDGWTHMPIVYVSRHQRRRRPLLATRKAGRGLRVQPWTRVNSSPPCAPTAGTRAKSPRGFARQPHRRAQAQFHPGAPGGELERGAALGARRPASP
jgi:hypothetical protein